MSLLSLEPVAVPLREDTSGAIRVGNTRVLLEVVIRAFDNGASPETVAQSYDALTLADVYAVLAYYLAHQDEVDRYLMRCEEEAEDLRRHIESRQPARRNLREILRQRADAMEKNRAPATQ